MPNRILFYDQKAHNGFMSNYYEREITIDGLVYPSCEHYYQSMKYHPNEKVMERVRKAETPGKAKALGRSSKYLLREDWETVKFDVMKKALLAKFSQHEDLKRLLLKTGDAELVENAPKDYIWGCGTDGSGANHLGRLLMDVRADIRQMSSPFARTFLPDSKII